MSPLHVGAVCTLLLGGAVAAVVRGLRRAPGSVAAARREMGGTGVDDGRRPRWAVADGAPSRWVASRLGDDLVLLGTTPTDVATRALTTGLLTATIVGLGVLALASVGVLPGAALLVAPLSGAGGAWAVQRGTANDAARRRKEFRRAAGDFVQLVAIGLTTDQSVEESIRFALDVGAGTGFDELRHELAAAPMRGVTVWEAIDAVGTRYGVRELCEFAASIERQGLQGVAIGDTVASLSAGMRAKALDELEREADRANANLSGPTIGFVVATIVFLAYPLAQRISDAFGG